MYSKNWEALSTVISPHLKEITVRTRYHDTSRQCMRRPQAIDKLLCDSYDRSRVRPFRVNLDLTNIGYISENERSLYVEQLQEAWPDFLEKGTVELSFKPWKLGKLEQDIL